MMFIFSRSCLVLARSHLKKGICISSHKSVIGHSPKRKVGSRRRRGLEIRVALRLQMRAFQHRTQPPNLNAGFDSNSKLELLFEYQN